MSANASTEYNNELPVGYRLEEFEIKSVLGSGGFGITYLALDVDLKRDVVVKENLPFQCAVRDSTRSVRPRTSASGDRDQFEWALNSFMREAETISQFDHPNIVRILRRFEANNTAYFVMPYLPGTSLKQVIEEQVAKQEAFTEGKLKDLLNPLLDALQTLHAAGVYHRDIKAANILLVKGHRPILIDFGAARQFISEKSHTIVESAGYTPFEQLQSHGNVGPWSDIYALAATFYTAIHGEAPPRASDRIRRDPIVKLSDQYSDVYSRPFLDALDWALKVDEMERPQTIEAWRDALNGTGAGATSGATTRVPPKLPEKTYVRPKQEPVPKTEAAPQPAQPFPWNFVLTLAGGAVAALLLLALLLHFLWPWLATPGSLQVTSIPSQATVHIPGQQDMATPAQFPKLRVGKHVVTVSAPGYDSATITVEIKEGTAYPLDTVQLKRTYGTLVLQSTPARVSFKLLSQSDADAKEMRGMTPATLDSLPAGPYQLTLSANGLGTRTLRLDVPGHQTTTQALDLVKLSVCGDTSSDATKALLGQMPPGQLDDNGKKQYGELLAQSVSAYLRYNMFAEAAAQVAALKKLGRDTADLEKKIGQMRDSFEKSVSGKIVDLGDDRKFGAANSRLKAIAETLGQDTANRLAGKYQMQISSYQQESAGAIQQAQAGDPAAAYGALKAFGDKHPDDVQVQIALGKLLTRLPPDHDRLAARLVAYKNFDQQYLGATEAGELQEMQAHLQGEFDAYNDLLARLNRAKAGPGNLAHRIAVLQEQIADNQRKIDSGQGVDKAVNAVTGLFGQHVRVTSAASLRAAVDREQAELNQDLAAQQNFQADSSGAQGEFDAFCAKVPW